MTGELAEVGGDVEGEQRERGLGPHDPPVEERLGLGFGRPRIRQGDDFFCAGGIGGQQQPETGERASESGVEVADEPPAELAGEPRSEDGGEQRRRGVAQPQT